MTSGMARARLAPITLAVLLATILTPPPLLQSARAADAGLVFDVLRVIVENHVDRPDPVRLLAATVAGLRETLTRAGVRADLPDLTATAEAEARGEFQDRFDRAVVQAQGRLSELQLRYAAAAAMADSLDDSHTFFLNPERWAERTRLLQGNPSFVGIGVSLLNRDGRFYIWRVFAAGPAARAGLQPLDRITGIDGQSTQSMSTDDVVSRVRGPEGSSVTLTVQRPGQAAPMTVMIPRAPIAVPPTAHRVLENQIGYLEIIGFPQGSAARVRQVLTELREAGIRGLILDLRRNSGGSLNEVLSVSSLLLPPDLPVFRFMARDENVLGATTGTPLIAPSLPMVVLMDEGTASGGELLAAALQEHGRAQTVGVRTAGALLVSRAFTLSDGSGVSVTVAKITTGKGATLEKNGLRPDVEIPLVTADLDQGIDAQFQRALQLLLPRVAVAR